jgi:hypothetical protein
MFKRETGSVQRKSGVVPGFGRSLRRFRSPDERSDIRERWIRCTAAPDVASLIRATKKEEKIEGGGTPANAGLPPHLAMRRALFRSALV